MNYAFSGPKAYRTTDLHVAAFLIARGHRLVGIERSGRLQEFCFDADAAGDVRHYFENAAIGSRDYGRALRNVKRALHEGK